MKQIYNFEGAQPPPLSEAALKQEKSRRRSRRQAMWFAVVECVLLVWLGLLVSLLAKTAVIAAVVCMLYGVLSILGSSTVVLLCAQKGGATI